MKYSITSDGTKVWGIDLKKRIPDLFTLRTHEPVTKDQLKDIILASHQNDWRNYFVVFKTILKEANLNIEQLTEDEINDIMDLMIEVFE